MHHSENDMSSAANAYVERARDWAVAIEDAAAKEARASLRVVRPSVAREVGVSPGTLENLRAGRLKGIAAHIYERLQAATLRRLQAEVQRIEHEIHVLKAQGLDGRSDEMAAALADRSALRRALGLSAEEPAAPSSLNGGAR